MCLYFASFLFFLSLPPRSKAANILYENVLVSGYCQFPNNSLKCCFALKSYPFKKLNISARTNRQALEMKSFFCPSCQNLHTKKLINLQECVFPPHMPVFERFEYLITGPLRLQITRKQYVWPTKGYHGQVQSA